jgi:hypothetical protein
VTRDDPDAPEPEARRYPSTFGGLCYLAILVATSVGLLWVILGDWRVGTRVIGGALIAAGLARLVLRQRSAGMLAVRHRLVDVVMLVAVGASVVLLSGSIPEQPL